MFEVIAVCNQKGGVGKTTTCVNLAASLALLKKKVLIVDVDPQGNATMGSGVDKYSVKNGIYELLIDDVPIDEVIIDDLSFGYHLIPSNSDTTAAEIKLMDSFARETKLKNVLMPLNTRYDFILIDCPPSLNMLTVNAMSCAHSVLVPMQCEYYALEGLTALVDTIEKLSQVVNPSLKISGLLRTMYDKRNRLSVDVSEQLTDFFGEKVYKTIIPRNVRLAEAPSFGKPAIFYDKYSLGSQAYLKLGQELIGQMEKISVKKKMKMEG